MHNAPKNYAEYHKEIEGSLQDQFLRKTLDSFAIAYRENRERIFKDVDEHALIHAIADMKDDACKHMEELYAQFKAQAEARRARPPCGHGGGGQRHHRPHRQGKQRQTRHQVQVHDG